LHCKSQDLLAGRNYTLFVLVLVSRLANRDFLNDTPEAEPKEFELNKR
jgi:hypothetical protein